ncbi:MAG: polysaccharide biosynthesis protein GumB [Rhizobiales bacterium]|nr:polysaccharide biosynthesis protein GumB [Hyphomicrobiales bacterium]MBA69613.1 polysaccharide biosynthesis protein GumB [Hyphomicrobiales bacterium]|tara:strand:+ start:2684 stop:3424 length:741 start_codon:yes stop_codon:yes gene_type:complete
MSMFNKAFRIAVLCAIALATVACASPGGTRTPSSRVATDGGDLRLVDVLPPPAGSEGGREQLLMPGDVLKVEVFQADQLSRTAQIDSTGLISLPLIGTLTAAGKTQRDLEREIRSLYGARYLQNPDVTVFIEESAGQRVTVDGEVTKAGLYEVSPGTTLLDALALAGGFRELADKRKVYIYRSVGPEKLVANYDVGSIRDGRAANPRIYGGDVVVVFTSSNRVAMNSLKDALELSARVAGGLVAPF